MHRLPVLIALSSGLAGCIDPLVSDAVAPPELILPTDAVVPIHVARPGARAALEAADGLPDGVDDIPLRSAFAGGSAAQYWDFGEASAAPIPLYLLVAETEDGGVFETARGTFSPIPHKPIFDAIPGDAGYSPWWTVVLLPVTEAYDGELLTSFAAVDEAFREGLVEAPLTLDVAVNCPVVLPEARLERAPGEFETASNAYYRGAIVHYFSFDTIRIEGGSMPVTEVYQVRREGGEPISEATRGVDFTDDGDLFDTNDVFAAIPGDEGYSGLVRPVEVVVTAARRTVDATRVEGDSDVTDAALIFPEGAPDPELVVAVHPRAGVFNRPIRPEAVAP